MAQAQAQQAKLELVGPEGSGGGTAAGRPCPGRWPGFRPHRIGGYARTLWAWSDGLEAQLDRARALTSEATVRTCRLYLAGCAMCFERGWLSLYQLLAARPDAGERFQCSTDFGPARSDDPFTRKHMLL